MYQSSVLFFAENRVGGTKYSTYIYREQISVWRLSELLTPHPLSTQRVCPPPAPKAGGYTLARGQWLGGGQYFGRRQTLDWPLTVYPSTVGGLERTFPFLDLFLHLLLRKSFFYGVRREISSILRIFSAPTSLLFHWVFNSFEINLRLNIRKCCVDQQKL